MTPDPAPAPDPACSTSREPGGRRIIRAVDGEIGEVQGCVVDPVDGRVTHVLLREGHFWGHKDIAIPVSAVVGMDDGVRLNITKQQVKDLPPVE